MMKKIKSVAILTLIPIFLTFLFGAALSKTYVEHIPIGILDLDQSSASRYVIDSLADSEGLALAAYASSWQELEKMMLRGEIRGGLVIPDDFGKNLQRSNSPEVLVLVDFSNILIGNSITAYANTVFNTLNAGLSMNILQAGQIVPYIAEQSVITLSFAERMLYEPRNSYFIYLYAIILAILIQQLYLSVVAPLFVEEKQRLREIGLDKTKRYSRLTEIIRLAKEVLLYAGCSLLSAFASLTIAHQFFGYPTAANPLLPVLLQIIFLISLTAIAILFGVTFEDVAHCGQLIMLLSIPTILFSGYVWPGFMMDSWVSIIAHTIWPLIYFINPLHIIHLKGAGLTEISSYIIGGLVFAVAWSCLASAIYVWRIKKPTATCHKP